MTMLPPLERAAGHCVCESAVVDLAVNRLPPDGKGAKPDGKISLRTLSERFEFMNLHKEWGRGQLPKYPRVVMKIPDNRFWRIYRE